MVLVQAATTTALGLRQAGDTSLDPCDQEAVRSMAASWHNLLFGAFDPAGTLSVDKLPLAFWPQAAEPTGRGAGGGAAAVVGRG